MSGQKHESPVPFARPDTLTVVLVEVGDDPQAIADVLREAMGLTITDLEALSASVPLVLFESLERARAEELRFRLGRAGGEVELRVPRQPSPGLRKPGDSLRAA